MLPGAMRRPAPAPPPSRPPPPRSTPRRMYAAAPPGARSHADGPCSSAYGAKPSRVTTKWRGSRRAPSLSIVDVQRPTTKHLAGLAHLGRARRRLDRQRELPVRRRGDRGQRCTTTLACDDSVGAELARRNAKNRATAIVRRNATAATSRARHRRVSGARPLAARASMYRRADARSRTSPPLDPAHHPRRAFGPTSATPRSPSATAPETARPRSPACQPASPTTRRSVPTSTPAPPPAPSPRFARDVAHSASVNAFADAFHRLRTSVRQLLEARHHDALEPIGDVEVQPRAAAATGARGFHVRHQRLDGARAVERHAAAARRWYRMMLNGRRRCARRP